MVTTTNTSDKVLKILDKYITQHGVTRKIHVESFCNSEGIEIVYSPVNDHRGTGSVEKTMEA